MYVYTIQYIGKELCINYRTAKTRRLISLAIYLGEALFNFRAVLFRSLAYLPSRTEYQSYTGSPPPPPDEIAALFFPPSSRASARYRKLCSYGNSVVNLPVEQAAAVSNYRMDFDSLRLPDITGESGSILRFFWGADTALCLRERRREILAVNRANLMVAKRRIWEEDCVP